MSRKKRVRLRIPKSLEKFAKSFLKDINYGMRKEGPKKKRKGGN